MTEEQGNQITEVHNLSNKIVVIAEETAAATEQVAASAQELASGMNLYY